MTITPIYRSDGSGDTYAFTNYLSKVSKYWKGNIGYSTTISFPAGLGAKGNLGVTQTVQATPGAIGYISASYLIAAKLHAAAIENEAKKFILPNLKNISAAAEMVKKVPANNELHIVDPPKKYTLAYPISTFTYCIVPHGAPKKGELEQFINYAMTTGQKYGPALDFAPLPKVVLDASKRAVTGL
jgi:phosphate transport system substrate-binding protein